MSEAVNCAFCGKGFIKPDDKPQKIYCTDSCAKRVAIWPSAVDDWSVGRRDADGDLHETADDLGFLRRLVGMLAEAGLSDPSRADFAGPSLGGTMVLRGLCDPPDLLAGAAITIASLPVGTDCPPWPAKPVLYIDGVTNADFSAMRAVERLFRDLAGS